MIPVCGAGFSLNVRGVETPPDWPGLVDLARASTTGGKKAEDRLNSEDRNRLELLAHHCKDSLSALSLLQESVPTTRSAVVKELKRTTRPIKAQHLPCHSAFWSTRWPLVVTTNFDRFLEVAAGETTSGSGRVQTVGYDKEQFTKVLLDETRKDDVPTIVHAHGLLGGAAKPLITWGDYMAAYGKDRLDELVKHIVKTPRGLLRRQRLDYRKIMEGQLRRAAEQVPRKDVRSRIRELIDRLLADYTCLFIGFSIDDPVWRLILNSLTRTKDSSLHYMIIAGSGTTGLGKRVRAVNIVDWNAMPEFFRELSARIGKQLPIKDTGEARSRERRYSKLRKTYPRFEESAAPAWMIRGRKKGVVVESIVPFVELWHNERGVCESKVLDCRVERVGPFRVRRELVRVRNAYWRYREKLQADKRNSAPLINERKLRVARWSALPNGGLRLHAQLADYQDYLVTNHFVANMDDRALGEIERDGNEDLEKLIRSAFQSGVQFSPRDVLCGDEDAVALTPNSACSNHLGVSLMLVADVPGENGRPTPVLICPPSRGQISSPNDLIMVASGSVDWPLRANAKEFGDVLGPAALRRDPSRFWIWAQIWRKFAEECRHNENTEKRLAALTLGRRFTERFKLALRERKKRIHRAELINLCQNIERGGKPELFYLGSVKGPGKEFIVETLRFNWELETVYSMQIAKDIECAKRQRNMMLLPSPVDVDLDLVRRPVEPLRRVFEILLDSSFNPVLRAHLASVVRFCEVRFPDRTRRALAKLRGEFEFTIGCARRRAPPFNLGLTDH